jgi:delta-1-pyrroline-5-carboxylate synthetase
MLFLYLTVMFMQLDVASSQLLVTDSDFQDPAFRQQLSTTVNTLLQLRVVPVFNENDAIRYYWSFSPWF